MAEPTTVAASLPDLFDKTKDERTDESLQPNSTATPFSTFFWTAFKALSVPKEESAQYWKICEDQFADDVEWCMMNNGQLRRGKAEVIPFLKSGGYGSQKTPAPINNIATKEWGVWEYWNIGTLTEDIVKFAQTSQWHFPHDPATLVGKTYKVPVAFFYNINAAGKIYRVREYLDTQSLMAQFA